jgi:glycosyltransferase involved in cell wall biosynthesis
MKKKLVIITDAWYPQVNGVVTTYTNLIQNIDHDLYDVDVIEPSQFKTIPIPFYKEINLSIVTKKQMLHKIKESIGNSEIFRIHIATEGPLGLQAKRVLDEARIRYSTAYHTKFPEFLNSMFKIPVKFTKWYFDWFHKDSKFVLVPSKSVVLENPKWKTKVMGRGYGKEFKFNVNRKQKLELDIDFEEKKLLYVGRVSKEKSVEEFCKINIPHVKKCVIGNGPQKKYLKKRYPDVEFLGYKFGKELARGYSCADVFVFPSKTDTFGIVILEAMACGTPVASYDVTGPRDQIINGVNGYMSSSLTNAVIKCFNLDREKVYNSVKHISWKKTAEEFIRYIEE